MKSRKNRHAAELSKLGSRKGGRARAKALSAEHRSRIARRAAAARWGKGRYDEDRIGEFCARHRIRRLYLFGSVLRADFDAKSDVDVLIEYAETPSFGEYLSMQAELERIFGRRVDLITTRALNSMPSATRREAILSSARLIHAQ